MSASNLGNDYINEENSPIPIPPAKDGWADMERRLNAAPTEVRLKKRPQVLHQAAVLGGIAVVSGIAFAIAYYAIIGPNTHHPPQQHPALTDTPSAIKPADESISPADTLQHNYFFLKKYLPSTSGIASVDGVHGVTPVIVTSDINSTGVNFKPSIGNTSAGIGGNNINPDVPDTSANATADGRMETKGTTAYSAAPAGSRVGDRPIAHYTRTGKYISINKKMNVVTRKDAYNTSPTPTANNTSGNNNVSGASAILFREASINASPKAPENSRLLLQSLPLFAGNGSALHHRPPHAIASHFNTMRKHELPEWQLFLQWQAPVPLSGSAYYFSGPNGNNQVYRMLIPGIRVVRKFNANSISLDLTPFTAQTYNDLLIRESKNINPDTSASKIKAILHKEFGSSTTLLYHRRIFKKWQMAAGIQFNYWMNQSTDVQTFHTAPWGGSVIDSSKVIVKEGIQRQQWKIPLEAYYDAPRWQVGVRVEMPLNISPSDSITARIKTPVQLQLLFRYKLLPWRK